MSKSQAEQAVDAWFAGRGWKVFPFQRAVWKAALAGQSGLLHANTGAGKTYAVWIAALLRGANRSRRQASGLRVLWLTPMRALAADTQRSLEVSAQELGALARTRSACGTSARAPATPARPSARARPGSCRAR
jgi:ATP-dependent Lhr-like helicase